ncbi:unnamed protein product [Chrysoparadoxa australica]
MLPWNFVLLCHVTLAVWLLLLLGSAEGAQYQEPATSWLQQSSRTNVFPPRNGHGFVAFKDKLWVVGGRSDVFQSRNLASTNRRADVWSSDDEGATWLQQTDLTGDFAVQNWDALIPGAQAPWYGRFGHTLTVLEAAGGEEVMVMTGGFTPDPNNDVWVTEDGRDWRFAQNAPWEKRAWHADAVFNRKLLIMGGTPLINDVWTSESLVRESDGSWGITWRELLAAEDSPWMPRAGHSLVLQPVNNTLFMMGGFAGWRGDSSSYDGERCRNDIWSSQDGSSWSLVTEDAPWEARAWHTVATWSALDNPLADIAPPDEGHEGDLPAPRMWLGGGGYMGTKGNNIVRRMIGFVDMWWSTNGLDWHQVNHQEGFGGSLYSNMEWAKTVVDNERKYLGKWGMQMLASSTTTDDGTKVPALYFAGGDHVDDGALSNAVFVSNYTLGCLNQGVACGGVGSCGTNFKCDCPKGTSGSFCDSDTVELASSASTASYIAWPAIAVLLLLFV